MVGRDDHRGLFPPEWFSVWELVKSICSNLVLLAFVSQSRSSFICSLWAWKAEFLLLWVEWGWNSSACGCLRGWQEDDPGTENLVWIWVHGQETAFVTDIMPNFESLMAQLAMSWYIEIFVEIFSALIPLFTFRRIFLPCTFSLSCGWVEI